MAQKTLGLAADLQDYLLAVSLRETPIAQQLRERTQELEYSNMLSSPEQVQFIVLLLKTMRAKQVLEVGTFTGYTALNVALALPEDGKIVCCDISEEWTSIGQAHWRQASVDHKIELQLAPAMETLQALLEQGAGGRFDFAYIDADKSNYQNYFDACYELVRPGGLIAIDNVLWSGAVIDANDQSEDTVAIRAFNHTLQQDERLDISMVPIGDGLTLASKR